VKVVFYASEGKKFDETLAARMGKGVKRRGDAYEVLPIKGVVEPLPDTDVAILAGVKGGSKPCFEAHRRAGRHAIILDKGYTRLRGGELGTLYWRLSVDDFQPHAYLRAGRPGDRWERLGMTVLPMWKKDHGQVLFCGSSQKYCDWHGLGDATEYARRTLKQLSRLTDRELVYRPKPSWGGAVPVRGFRYSSHEEKFVAELDRTFCVVTFGSNAAFEAVLAGVPALVLGDGIARPLCRTRLEDVGDPLYPTTAEVRQVGCDIAYCQWTLEEMASGECWDHVRPVLEASR
jgi:hypothetical protein